MWGVRSGVEPNHALWLQGVHPDDRDRVQAAADVAVDPAGDGIYGIEYRVVGLNGGRDDAVPERVRTPPTPPFHRLEAGG